MLHRALASSVTVRIEAVRPPPVVRRFPIHPPKRSKSDFQTISKRFPNALKHLTRKAPNHSHTHFFDTTNTTFILKKKTFTFKVMARTRNVANMPTDRDIVPITSLNRQFLMHQILVLIVTPLPFGSTP